MIHNQAVTREVEDLYRWMTPAERLECDRLIALVSIEEDWRTWAQTMFPMYCRGEFSDFHAFSWKWFWDLEPYTRMEGLLKIISRFFAKSTTLQMGAAACGARKTRQFVLYISETQKQADDHVQTMGAMLERSNLGLYYPGMAEPKTGSHGNKQSWKRSRFWTKDDFIVDAIGLDSAARGVKLEDKRPDLMIFDDIDGKHDSPHIIQKKIEIITNNLMPAGAEHCVYAVGQNMINKDGFVAQLEDGRLKIMKNRRFFGIVPAIRNFKYEREDGDFATITGGTPTWEFMSLEKLQHKMDEIGLEAFLTECQHEVSLPLSGAIFGEWNEAYHIITDEEFAAGYEVATGEEVHFTPDGRAQMPYQFRIARFQDVGTTKDHPNVTGHWSRPPEISPLADTVFSQRELVFPGEWWNDKAVFKAFSIGEIAEELYDIETRAGERHRISDADCFMSHEGSSELLTYERDVPVHHRIFWNKWKGDFSKMFGVSIMKNFMTVDMSRPHPFRKYPTGHELAGRPLPGRPRFFLIVKKGQGELYMDENGMMRVRKAIDGDGFRRARWEIPLYRLPKNASGEEAKLPQRINDDWISQAKAAAANLFPQPKPMTKEQRTEKRLAEVAPNYTMEAIEERAPDERQGALAQRNRLLNEIGNRQQTSKPASKLAALRSLKRSR